MGKKQTQNQIKPELEPKRCGDWHGAYIFQGSLPCELSPPLLSFASHLSSHQPPSLPLLFSSLTVTSVPPSPPLSSRLLPLRRRPSTSHRGPEMNMITSRVAVTGGSFRLQALAAGLQARLTMPRPSKVSSIVHFSSVLSHMHVLFFPRLRYMPPVYGVRGRWLSQPPASGVAQDVRVGG